MANYKVIARGKPGAPATSEKKFYAAPVTGKENTLESLTTSIEKISTVSGADIRAVLYALVDVSMTCLEAGEIVRLGDLGSMRISINSEGKNTEKEVTALAIKRRSIIFTPSIKLKKMLSAISFQKQ